MNDDQTKDKDKDHRDTDHDDQFNEEFQRIHEMLRDIMKKALASDDDEPYIYGFSMKRGPDGKPHIEEFTKSDGPQTSSNEPKVPESKSRPLESPSDQIKPSDSEADIIDTQTRVFVTLDVSDVPREDIHLGAKLNLLIVYIDSSRHYYKEINLPSEVDEESIQATYKNGILDVTLEKA